MKTNRTSAKGSANGAAKQASTQPNKPKAASPEPTSAAAIKLMDSLQLLVPGCHESEDGIWASPDGSLYFWDGALSVEPLATLFPQARAWWERVHQKNPYLAEPFYPEDSGAQRFVSLVCDAIKSKHAAKPAQTAPGSCKADLEDAVRASTALTTLLSSHIASPEGDNYTAALRDTFDCGMMLLCATTNDRLLKAFYGRNGGGQ